jgi:MFS family permease
MTQTGTDMTGRPAAGSPDRLLTPEILSLAAAVVLGAIMTILDATIVNAALPTLGKDFHASIAAISGYRPSTCWRSRA